MGKIIRNRYRFELIEYGLSDYFSLNLSGLSE
jgi:hypothetical protein